MPNYYIEHMYTYIHMFIISICHSFLCALAENLPLNNTSSNMFMNSRSGQEQAMHVSMLDA